MVVLAALPGMVKQLLVTGKIVKPGNFAWRSPVGAPVPRSSDLPDRLGQFPLREFAVLTPMLQLAIAPRRLQRRQGQHSVWRPTHPTVLAPPRHRPVVELLHPRARDPQARPLTL